MEDGEFSGRGRQPFLLCEFLGRLEWLSILIDRLGLAAKPFPIIVCTLILFIDIKW